MVRIIRLTAIAATCALFAPGVLADSVGRVEGAFSVSDSGAANYSIPIKITPGIAGMEPKLSLTYSSGAPNGLLGRGWGLAGLSAIRRCDKTIAQDGSVRGVVFDAYDRFCLDGSQLRLVSGTYGQSGSEYRTEIESFMRITASGVAGSGPASFQAKTRDGVTIDYGATADSRIEATGRSTVRSWAVNRITDAHGNYMDFEYTEDSANGSYRPSKIFYTGHAGQSPGYSVEFTYEQRPLGDTDPMYLWGSVIREMNRMTSIGMYYNGAQVRRYDFGYHPEASILTHRSLLKSITECAGTSCLPPTQITYQNSAVEFQPPLASTVHTADAENTQVLDINGDGREDLAYVTAGTWWLRMGQADGRFGAAANTGIASTNYQYALATDYNGDGLGDLVVPLANNGYWRILKSNGTTLTVQNTTILVDGPLGGQVTGDVNGDGWEDLLYIKYMYSPQGALEAYLFLRLNSATGYQATGTQVLSLGSWAEITFGKVADSLQSVTRKADFNGDGRMDLWMLFRSKPCVEYTCQQFYIWQSLIWTGSQYAGGQQLPATYDYKGVPSLLDVNGDGNTDTFYCRDGQCYLAVAKGDGTFVSSAIFSATGLTSPFLFFDYDADGRDDILLKETATGRFRFYRSNGAAFDTPITTGITAPATATYPKVMNINGDGLHDAAWYDGTTWNTYPRTGPIPDLASAFTDGFGNTQSVSYKALADWAAYTKQTNAVFPVFDIKNSMQVVTTATLSDGIGRTYNLSYSYEGAKTHVQGRGFLGFVSTSVTDSRDALTTTRNYFQTFPYIGMLQNETLKQYSNTLSYASSGADAHSFGAGYETRFFPYIKTTLQQQYETTGALVRSINATNTFDVYGNLKDMVSTASDTAGNSYTSETHRDFLNDTANWCLGRMTSESNKNTLPDGSNQTRVKTATYDATFCRIETATDQPGPLQVHIDYGYDTWGNQNVITVTGAGMTPRTTTRNFAPEGVFPREVFNAKNHKTTHTWNFALGVESSRADANNLTVSWLHDGFGRLVRETRPDGTKTEWLREYCSLGCGVGNGHYKVTTAVKNASTEQPGGSGTVVLDRFDREVRSSRAQLNGQETQALTEYDNQGRVLRKSAPYLAGGATYWSTFQYDVLDRIRVAEHPMSESQPFNRLIEFSYNGLVTSVFDPKLHSATRRENARGEVMQITDALNKATSYAYNPFGELKSVTDPLGNIKSMTYDERGNKRTMSDPDMGSWSYLYNALGELKSQTDAKNQTQSMDYDVLGRPIQRVEPEATTTWDYDTASGKGIGRLASSQIVAAGGGVAYREYMAYDDVGRLSEHTTDTDGRLYSTQTAYDALGRIDTVTYPDTGASARFAVRYEYDASGVLKKVVDAANSNVEFWQANSMNAWGMVTDERLGNGLVTAREFDLARGMLNTIDTGGGSIQDLVYEWDPAGNLNSRSDVRIGKTESFVYDELNRLKTAQVNANPVLGFDYDEIGNIKTKSGVGTYIYGARPHAVTSITGARANDYTYDANGNMRTGAGRTVDWTSFNYPSQIAEGSEVSTFAYGPGRMRYKHVRARNLYVPDTAPNASFSHSCSGVTCNFNGSSSTDDVGISSYVWNFGDGQTATGASVAHAYSGAGVYSVTLTITDTVGQQASTTRSVNVDTPPIAAYTHSCQGLTCSFNGSGSSDNSGIVQYTWNFGDGQSSSGVQTPHTYAAPGLYNITLTVRDAAGQTDTETKSIQVYAPPKAAYTYYCAARVCSFDAAGSTDDHGIVEYSWVFDDGQTATGPQVNHLYLADGEYQVVLTVRDADGLTDTEGKTIYVALLGGGPTNNPPSASFAAECTYQACTFDASASTDDTGIVSYAWDYGDGQTGVGAVASHVYSAAGLYIVTLTVTDTGGRSDSETATAPAARTAPTITDVYVWDLLWERICDRQAFCSALGLPPPFPPDPGSVIPPFNCAISPEVCNFINDLIEKPVPTLLSLVNVQECRIGPVDLDQLRPGFCDQITDPLALMAQFDWTSTCPPLEPCAIGDLSQYTAASTYNWTLVAADPWALFEAALNSALVPASSSSGDSQSSSASSSAPILRPAGSETTTIYYIGSLYERRETGSAVEHLHYIRVGAQTIAVRTLRSSGVNSTQYLHKDSLGSVDAITDEQGAVVERLSYDSFGKRRLETWDEDGDTMLLASHAQDRGYTGHEHLDHLALIHMNGRVYDPVLGRMISADPTVPNPWDLQSHNRYSYVNNNPLTFTDPSGFDDVAIEEGTALDTISVTCDRACQSSAGGGSFGLTWGAMGGSSGGSGSKGMATQMVRMAAARFFRVASEYFKAAEKASQSSNCNSAGSHLCGLYQAQADRAFAKAVTNEISVAIEEAMATIAGTEAKSERSVYSASDGFVADVGWENPADHNQGYGYRVKIISDDDGSVFTYAHMDPQSLSVSEDARVSSGDFLGEYADPPNGVATGPHLHFEWRSPSGIRLDPSGFLSVVMPNHFVSRGIRYQAHPVTGKPKWHNGYDLVGPQ